jgi:hypothetical protein
MPSYIERDTEEVIAPGGSGHSNLMLQIRRAMRACGIAVSDARWTFMRLFCAHCALRGQLWRIKVSRAMEVIIRDDRQIQFGEASTFGLRCEITRLRRRLVRLAAADRSYHVDSVVAIVGGNQPVNDE